jgi:hypothetical protein
VVILVVIIGLGENLSKQYIFVVRFNRQRVKTVKGLPADWVNGA